MSGDGDFLSSKLSRGSGRSGHRPHTQLFGEHHRMDRSGLVGVHRRIGKLAEGTTAEARDGIGHGAGTWQRIFHSFNFGGIHIVEKIAERLIAGHVGHVRRVPR